MTARSPGIPISCQPDCAIAVSAGEQSNVTNPAVNSALHRVFCRSGFLHPVRHILSPSFHSSFHRLLSSSTKLDTTTSTAVINSKPSCWCSFTVVQFIPFPVPVLVCHSFSCCLSEPVSNWRMKHPILGFFGLYNNGDTITCALSERSCTGFRLVNSCFGADLQVGPFIRTDPDIYSILLLTQGNRGTIPTFCCPYLYPLFQYQSSPLTRFFSSFPSKPQLHSSCCAAQYPRAPRTGARQRGEWTKSEKLTDFL